MSKRQPDFFLKRIWLINGILILALCIFATGSLVVGVVTNMSRQNHQVVNVTQTQDTTVASPRAVRFGSPVLVPGTKTRLVRVRYGADYYDDADYKLAKSGLGSAYDSRSSGPTVNAVFLQPDGTGHLLFDKPVTILRLDYASEESIKQGDQQWITYEVVTGDTNDNGQLGEGDRVDLYITDGKGYGLKRVLDDKFTYETLSVIDGGKRMVVYALEKNEAATKDKQLRQIAFLYEPATGQLKSYDLLNKLTDKAARLVGKGK